MQGLPEIWLQTGGSPGETNGRLGGQWLLKEGADEIRTHTHTHTRELKQGVCQHGEEEVYAEKDCGWPSIDDQILVASSLPGFVNLPCL